jgi:zinc finger HIT domain-containing protein 1
MAYGRLEADRQRTNPTDIPASSFVPQQPTPASNIPGMPAGLIIAQPAKKKQTPNVRKILYAKKNLRDWLEELVRLSHVPLETINMSRGPAVERRAP